MIAGIVADGMLPGALSAVVIFAALYGSIAWAVLGAEPRRTKAAPILER
jgi:hypothetical protein